MNKGKLLLFRTLKLARLMKNGFSSIWMSNNFNRVTKKLTGLVRDLNPGPLAPKARIIPLDQRADLVEVPLDLFVNQIHPRIHAQTGVAKLYGFKTNLKSMLKNMDTTIYVLWDGHFHFLHTNSQDLSHFYERE